VHLVQLQVTKFWRQPTAFPAVTSIQISRNTLLPLGIQSNNWCYLPSTRTMFQTFY